MDIKSEVIELLNKKELMLDKELTEIQNVIKVLKNGRAMKSFTYKKNIITQRLYSLNYIIKLISKINFNSNVRSVYKCLSPYGTFCDRNNLYYNENVLCKYNREQILQIVSCEIFNSLQSYFTHNEISEELGSQYRGRSITCMYHVNIINEHINLYNYNEQLILEKFNKKYPNNRIISFAPNSNAARYIMDSFIFHKNNSIGDILEKWDMEKALILKINPKYLHITEHNGIEMVSGYKYYDKGIYYIIQDGEYIRTNYNNAIIRECINSIRLTKKLTGK